MCRVMQTFVFTAISHVLPVCNDGFSVQQCADFGKLAVLCECMKCSRTPKS